MTKSPIEARNLFWLVGSSLAVAASTCLGQVTLDGTLGTLGRTGLLVAPNYQITSDMGRQVGPNLFHSFNQFNLTRGETATFSGPSDVQNILTRVTGGNVSSIDGVIKSEIIGANFYLLNPAGIIFGAKASLNISGSFTACTADYLKLGDGGSFHSTQPRQDVLSSAPVEAFGFFGPTAGTIRIDGSRLAVNEGRAISLVGGNVELDHQAEAKASSGRVSLLSVKSAGEFTESSGSQLANLEHGGEIKLDDRSSINVSGKSEGPGGPGGQVIIRGGTLVMNNASHIMAETTGSTQGAGIDIQLKGGFSMLLGTTISTKTVSDGNAGAIHVAASDISIDGQGIIASINANTDGSTAKGKAGEIDFEAGGINILNGGYVSAVALNNADAGTIKLSASQAVKVNGGGDFAALSVNSEPDRVPGGNAGRITIETPKLEVTAAGVISSAAYGAGRGGTVEITAEQIQIDGRTAGSGNATGITTQNIDGAGGAIEIHTSRLDILGGATIFSGTDGSGGGGRIDIKGKDQAKANLVHIDGQGGTSFTGIGAPPGASDKPGRIGQISINAQKLEILGGGEGAGVDTSTAGGSEAGKIDVHADQVQIDGRGLDKFTGIGGVTVSDFATAKGANIAVDSGELVITGNGFISAGSGGAGPGGNVDVTARQIRLQRGGSINSRSESSGASGHVFVNSTGLIVLTEGANISTSAAVGSAQGISVQSDDRIELHDSQITAQARLDAGELRLKAPFLIYLQNSTITTQAGQNGGNILIDPQFVVLNRSQINASAMNVNGGNVRIGSDFFIQSADSTLTASGGPFGVAGQISILGPIVDLTGGLLTLSGALLGAESRLPERCSVKLPREFSSFVVGGRGGLPLEPDDWQPSSLAPLGNHEVHEKNEGK